MSGRRPPPTVRYYAEREFDIKYEYRRAFTEALIDEILNNPEGCTLPLNLGWLKIVCNRGSGKFSIYNKKIDTKGKKLLFDNTRTEGKVFKVEWYSRVIGAHEDTLKKAFHNSAIYTFKSTATIRKKMTVIIKKDDSMWPLYHAKSFFKSAKSYLDASRASEEYKANKLKQNDNTSADSIETA